MMEGRPEKVGRGRTSTEAVGELISANFEMRVWLDLEIIEENPPVANPALQEEAPMLLLPDEMRDPPPH